MKVLCVAEKNSIAKAVAQILGGGRSTARDSTYMYVKNYDFHYDGFPFASQPGGCQVTMTSVAGHLSGVDFQSDRYGWGKCNVQELFDAPVSEVLDKNQRKIAENIKKEAQKADFLMIWTDCDREGEYIGWEIFREANRGNRRLTEAVVYRAVFSHLERRHILQAARNPQRLDMRSVNAVGTRMEIDLRAGVTFTRLLTETMRNKVGQSNGISRPANGSNANKKKDSTVISYGTCQFPTLGFVVDRFERIRNFVSEEFWYIQLQVVSEQASTIFQWERGHLFDRLSVLAIYEACIETAGNIAKVSDLRSKPTSKYRPLPLTTVELQKNCSRFFKLNAKQSLDAAEKLYQKGFLSYPRTETDTFPDKMDLKGLVTNQAQLDQDNTSRSAWANYAANLLSDTPGSNKFKWPRSGSHDDKAHPPIHPVISLGPQANVTPTERKIYEYVARHFLACCSEDAKGQSTTVTLDWGGEKFTATGLVVFERNFLDVYPWAKWETTKQVPRLELNQECRLEKCEMRSGSTSPPKPMTESELIMLMDVNGIGTDATIAEHIEKIQVRNYIKSEKTGKETYLQPTILGVALVHGFEAIGLEDSFAKPFQRKEMEDELRQICGGTRTKNDVIVNIMGKYRNYWAKTNSSKGKLLEVYDRVRATMS